MNQKLFSTGPGTFKRAERYDTMFESDILRQFIPLLNCFREERIGPLVSKQDLLSFGLIELFCLSGVLVVVFTTFIFVVLSSFACLLICISCSLPATFLIN